MANTSDPLAGFNPEFREQLQRMSSDQRAALLAALSSNSTNSKNPVSHQQPNAGVSAGVPRGLSTSRVAELLALPPSNHELDNMDNACNRSPYCATYGTTNQILKDSLLVQRMFVCADGVLRSMLILNWFLSYCSGQMSENSIH